VSKTDWRAELGAKTTESLGRFGVAGRVEVESHLVWLIGNGPTVEVALMESDPARIEQDPGQLQPIAERLARDLARARRKAAGQTGGSVGWLASARLLTPLVLVALAGWLAFRYLLPQKAPPERANLGAKLNRGLRSPAPKLSDKQLLDDQNCLRTVSRIQQGGTVTALDIDGWVVELSLLSALADLTPDAPALAEHFPMRPGELERKHHSEYTPLLNRRDSQQAGVLISKEPLASVAPRIKAGIVITWRGQYVAPYFDPTERAEYLKLASVLYEELHASHGALYARCVQGPARYLGSWFRGPDVGGALLMLVAAMEVTGGSAHAVDSDSPSGPEQWRGAMQELAEKLKPVTRSRAAYALSSSGGTVSERLGQFATVEFPFSPANRANLASSAIAAKVWRR